MFTKLRTRQRHYRLMTAAVHLVRETELRISAEPEHVTYEQVAALAFGRHQIRVEESEAADYLAAALVSRGHGIDHLPAVPAMPVIPADSF